MWHKNLLIFLYLIFGTSSFFDYSRHYGAEARYFSEGGGFNLQQHQQRPQQKEQEYFQNFYDQQQFQQPQPQQQQQQQPQGYDYQNEEKLAQIIDELYARQYEEEQAKAAQELEQASAQQPFLQQQQQPDDQQQSDDALEQLQQLSNDVKQIAATANQQQKAPAQPQQLPQAAALTAEKGEEESAPLPLQAKSEQPLTPMKKGQSEYVEFIEPPQSKVLKSIESMDKRVVAEHSGSGYRGVKLLSSGGNIMFMAIVAVCCVFVVAGVVGGAYYYNTRKQPENDFDDFTRYSPAGPGKKLQGFRNGIRMDENGDDSLAYKAQLHHYQQTKQKIMGTDDGLSPSITPTGAMSSPRSIHHNENSEDEAEDLEEHNYSVYECPGLAPTGDIEVSNPNFGHH